MSHMRIPFSEDLNLRSRKKQCLHLPLLQHQAAGCVLIDEDTVPLYFANSR
jgi:hypothetical protein